jgi:sphingosine kinase
VSVQVCCVCQQFEGRPKTKLTASGSGPRIAAEQRLPLYNILWIEINDGTSESRAEGASQQTSTTRQLVIHYAHPTSKDRLSVRQRKFLLPAASESSESTTQATRTFVSTIQSLAYGNAQPRRRAFVLVNPHAGPGGADKIWSNQVRPIFEAAHWQLDVIRTAYGGQAREIVRQLEIDKFDVIVPCSGDGLPHEVFNGLGDRPDTRQALEKIAVAHIPCGSGNALSLNLNGTHRPSLAALAIVKGVVAPMDLVSITQEVETDNGMKETKRSLSFLSQALGFVAELDLGTEHLRFLSDGRFAYGAIKQVVFDTPIYPVDLAVQTAIDGKEAIKAHYREYREKGPARVDEDEASHTLPWTKRERSSTVVDESGPSTPATEEGHPGTSGLPPLRYGTAADKLPHGWEMVPYDKIGLFYAGNVSRLALWLSSSHSC